MKQYFLYLGVLLTTACGAGKPSTLKDDPAVTLPGLLPSDSAEFKIQKEKFEGCYEIVGKTDGNLADESWVPGALATRVCAGASGENEFAGFGWRYLGDGAIENGVAGGSMGKDAECDDCMTVYHGWFTHAFKWRQIGSDYSLEIHANSFQAGQLVQILVTRIQLVKVSTSMIPDRTPTASNLSVVNKAFSGCYDLDKTHLYGDNVAQTDSDFYSKVNRVCFEQADFKKSGSYITATIENSVGEKKLIGLNDVQLTAYGDSLWSVSVSDKTNDETNARFTVSLDGSNELQSTIHIQRSPDYIFFDASGSRK